MDTVIDYIRANTGRLFDPECVSALLDNLEQFLAIRDRYLDQEELPEGYVA
ncbi:Putative response regulator [Vibrio vulnificus]|nr:Putative response regulator [Vibrio vulnificus]